MSDRVPAECRVETGTVTWPMTLTVEDVEVCRAMVPIREVWSYDSHDWRGGACSRCGAENETNA